MTIEKAKELHKQFLPGITLQMIGLLAAGLISIAFFVRGQYDTIIQNQKDDRKHTDSLTTIIAVRQDNRISALQDTVQSEIQSLRSEMNYRFQIEDVRHRPAYSSVTEQKVNGKLLTHQVK